LLLQAKKEESLLDAKVMDALHYLHTNPDLAVKEESDHEHAWDDITDDDTPPPKRRTSSDDDSY
jgi:hypothetical protein